MNPMTTTNNSISADKSNATSGKHLTNRILLTKYRDKLFFGLWEKGKPAELAFYEKEPDLQLGDICLGRVKDIVPGIRAAFVQLSATQNGYLPLEQAPEGMRCGDWIAVQLTKEAQKTKDPVISSKLSLTGRLVVLVTDNSRVSVSAKIRDAEWRAHVQERLKPLNIGFVVRTCAYQADLEDIYREAQSLIEQYQRICQMTATRTGFTKLLAGTPPWLAKLQHLAGIAVQQAKEYPAHFAEIVTDVPEIYNQCQTFINQQNMSDYFDIRLYNDVSYPLSKLYSLETVIEDALHKNVWLKSGGYLVIEPTEAMVVIDVNSGKAEGRKTKEENILKLNLEAADEAARQMRLRNLSGMILIDFIDMKLAENQIQLMNHLQKAVKNDPVGVTVIDMTRLGIVECTRRKTAKPLYEQLKSD